VDTTQIVGVQVSIGEWQVRSGHISLLNKMWQSHEGSKAKSLLPIFRKLFRAGLGGVLLMEGVRDGFASIVVKSIGQNPVRWIIGDWISNPLDVVEELTLVSYAVVFQVDDAVDEIFRLAIDNKCRRQWLIMIFEGIQVFWLELGDMEYRVYTDCARELNGKRHGQRL